MLPGATTDLKKGVEENNKAHEDNDEQTVTKGSRYEERPLRQGSSTTTRTR